MKKRAICSSTNFVVLIVFAIFVEELAFRDRAFPVFFPVGTHFSMEVRAFIHKPLETILILGVVFAVLMDQIVSVVTKPMSGVEGTNGSLDNLGRV